MRRYMVVEHPVESDQLTTVGNRVIGQVPIHSMLQDYHWARIDKTHVILIGGYSIGHHVALHSHDKVSVLPSQNSTKTIVNHPMKDAHKKALQMALSLDDSHTMETVLEKLELQYGPIFSPNK